jgi:hypothetical protein
MPTQPGSPIFGQEYPGAESRLEIVTEVTHGLWYSVGEAIPSALTETENEAAGNFR